MNDLPRYRLWCPTVEGQGTGASVILTSGTCARAPIGPGSFFRGLLDVAGITGRLVAWRTDPFVAAYFSGGDWQECWEVNFVLDDGKRLTRNAVAGVGVFEEPAEEETPSRYLPVRVFADFTRRRDAEHCKAELKNRAAGFAWDDVHYEGYSVRDVSPQHQQLVVKVSTGERSDLARIVDAAGAVVGVCESHGARTQAA
jgi:hypothetical protein